MTIKVAFSTANNYDSLNMFVYDIKLIFASSQVSYQSSANETVITISNLSIKDVFELGYLVKSKGGAFISQ